MGPLYPYFLRVPGLGGQALAAFQDTGAWHLYPERRVSILIFIFLGDSGRQQVYVAPGRLGRSFCGSVAWGRRLSMARPVRRD